MEGCLPETEWMALAISVWPPPAKRFQWSAGRAAEPPQATPYDGALAVFRRENLKRPLYPIRIERRHGNSAGANLFGRRTLRERDI